MFDAAHEGATDRSITGRGGRCATGARRDRDRRARSRGLPPRHARRTSDTCRARSSTSSTRSTTRASTRPSAVRSRSTSTATTTPVGASKGIDVITTGLRWRRAQAPVEVVGDAERRRPRRVPGARRRARRRPYARNMTATSTDAAQVRAQVDHPIIDADGHFVEVGPAAAGRDRHVPRRSCRPALRDRFLANTARALDTSTALANRSDPSGAGAVAGDALVVGLADAQPPRPCHRRIFPRCSTSGSTSSASTSPSSTRRWPSVTSR